MRSPCAPDRQHVETPGTGRCFVCGARCGPARPVAAARSRPDPDDWSDPATWDRDPDDDPDTTTARQLARRHLLATTPQEDR